MTGSYHDRQQNHETTTKRPPVDNQEITRKPPGDKTIQTPPGDNEPPRGHQHTRPKCFPQVLLRHSGEHNVSPIIGGFGSIAKMSFPLHRQDSTSCQTAFSQVQVLASGFKYLEVKMWPHALECTMMDFRVRELDGSSQAHAPPHRWPRFEERFCGAPRSYLNRFF